MNCLIQLTGYLHKHLVFSRRTEVLARSIAELLPEKATVLDVGSGDGLIAKKIMARKPLLTITGIDVLIRKESHIPVKVFDGEHIPYPESSFDFVLFVDVIHHTVKQQGLLSEAARVAKHGVIIKDHYADSWWKHKGLGVLDWVGNRPHGVPLPYAFLNRTTWARLWTTAGLVKEKELLKINLYPFPLNRIIDWPWNFIAKFRKTPNRT